MRPVAIIQHDHEACSRLCSVIEAAGLRSECFSEATHAIEDLRKRMFTLAVIDLDTLDTDPYAVCEEASRIVPVLTTSTRDDEEICLKAFACGADDHVVTPLPGRELVARIRNLLRRGVAPSRDPMSIYVSEMRVRDGEHLHELTRGEAEVLSLLLQYAPAPLTALRMSALLGVRRGTIESRIKSLRRKIGTGRLISRGRFGYQIE